MAAKLTRLTHKIAIQLHLVAAVPFTVLAPGGQSGNLWIHSRIAVDVLSFLILMHFVSLFQTLVSMLTMSLRPSMLTVMALSASG
jgi:hypothetical protein